MAKFTKLLIWQRGRELLQLVSAVTAGMRAEGDLKSQKRRAAISVVSNIAEGAECSDREFLRFLTIALGSTAEVRSQAIIATDIRCISQDAGARIDDLARQVECMIRGMMRYLGPPG